VSTRLGHFLIGLVLRDGDVSLRFVLDMHSSDLSVFDFHQSVVLPFLVDFMVPIGFEPLAEQLFRVMMVVMLRLGGCNRGTAKREQAENDKQSGEKTLYAIHVHG
jgi:hypothetical protein